MYHYEGRLKDNGLSKCCCTTSCDCNRFAQNNVKLLYHGGWVCWVCRQLFKLLSCQCIFDVMTLQAVERQKKRGHMFAHVCPL